MQKALPSGRAFVDACVIENPLQTLAQILAELGDELLLPVPDGLEAAEEEAKGRGFFHEVQPADELTVFI